MAPPCASHPIGEYWTRLTWRPHKKWGGAALIQQPDHTEISGCLANLSAILHQLIIAKSGCLANLSAIQHQLIITANTWKTYAVVLTIPKPVPRGKPDSTNEERIIGRLRIRSQIQWASKHADPVLCWRVISSIIKSQIWRHSTIACTIKAPLYWRSVIDCSALVQLSFDVHYVGFFLVPPFFSNKLRQCNQFFFR